MTDSIKIKLAARESTVRRLTLRQSRAIGIGIAKALPAEDGYAYAIDQAVGIITAALSRDHPEMTTDSLLDAEMTPRELLDVSRSILEFSGFVKQKEEKLGEAVAGAA